MIRKKKGPKDDGKKGTRENLKVASEYEGRRRERRFEKHRSKQVVPWPAPFYGLGGK